MTSRWVRWVMAGRQAKVSALACMVGCAGVVIGVRYEGPAQLFDFSGVWGVIDAGLAIAGLGLLTVGWWRRSKQLMRAGFFAAFAVFAARAVLGWIAVGPTHPAVWISVALAVLAGGSYVLESQPDE